MRGLYVHVPFCHKRCPYCHFDFTTDRSPREGFAGALLTEFRRKGLKGPYDTVYVGGGTPLLADLHPLADAWPWLRRAREVTVEMNPENLPVVQRDETLLKALGVTRVSVGVQSFHPQRLFQLGRGHTPDVAREAVVWLLEQGLNVNVDLLLCPFHDEETVIAENLRALADLRPHHVSWYMLEDPGHGTWFHRHLDEAVLDDFPVLYHQARQGLAALGYEQYEVSNWCLPGKQSQHNRLYWRGGVYDALGPSAAAFDGLTRWANVAGVAAYREALASSQPVVAQQECLSPCRRAREALVLALRTTQGASLRELKKRHPLSPAEWNGIRADLLEQVGHGTLVQEKGRFRLPPDLFPHADEVLCRLV